MSKELIEIYKDLVSVGKAIIYLLISTFATVMD
jgi:hypothetical protein